MGGRPLAAVPPGSRTPCRDEAAEEEPDDAAPAGSSAAPDWNAEADSSAAAQDAMPAAGVPTRAAAPVVAGSGFRD